MKNLFKYIRTLALMIVVIFSSCDSFDLDLTDNPNFLTPSQADVDFFLSSIQEDFVRQIEGDADYSWVTFLWRAEKEIENIIVLSQLDGSFFHVANKTLTRMPETNLWYKTYRVRNDVRTTYRFSPNDSLVHLSEDKDQEKRRANWQHDPLNPNKYVFPADEETKHTLLA